MISRRQVTPANLGEDDNPYWVSFSDIMAGLLVIFIFSVIYLMIQLYQVITINQETQIRVREALQQLAHIEQIREELLQEIQAELAERDIHVEVVEDSAVLRIPESQLYFEQGEHGIPTHLQPVVRIIGEKISEAIQKGSRLQFIDTVSIEGHTDSLPMNRGMGNWGLSSYRAISVWKYWTEIPGDLASLTLLRNHKGEPVFSVSGYADTRRAVVNERTEADRRRNRRIDIRFTMHTPDGADLQKLIKKLESAEQDSIAATL